MHIIGVVLGSAFISAGMAGLAVSLGMSGWTAFGLGVAAFVTAQLLYLVWIFGMAHAEARRRKVEPADTATTPAKASQRVAQKG